MNNYAMTNNVKEVLKSAVNLAYSLGENQVGTEHLLYGLANVPSSVASEVLNSQGATANVILSFIKRSKVQAKAFVGMVQLEYTPRVKDIIRKASSISYQVGTGYIVTEHLLYALLLDKGSMAVSILNQGLGIDVEKLLNQVLAIINGYEEDYYSYSSQDNKWTNNYEKNKENKSNQKNVNNKLPDALKDMGIDLTERARLGKMDPIIGREKESERIIEILCRKTKNNPVLIGEAGVGKSAVVEGLAQAIVKGDVPELLKGKTIFSLEIGSLMAGTKYRGSMDEKLKNAIETIWGG